MPLRKSASGFRAFAGRHEFAVRSTPLNGHALQQANHAAPRCTRNSDTKRKRVEANAPPRPGGGRQRLHILRFCRHGFAAGPPYRC
jgi:hypothetical protein